MIVSKNQGRRPLLEVEPLEARDVPSTVSTSVFISGTEMQYDAWGLPSAMAGNMYLAEAPQGGPIGRYEEALTPMLLGDQFVGTTGVSTFTFYVSAATRGAVQTITTLNTSYIVGMTPETGALLVGSQGTIVGSSGLFKGLSGSFTSSSSVVMGPQYSSGTNVNFSIQLAGPLSKAFVNALKLTARTAPAPANQPASAASVPAPAVVLDQDTATTAVSSSSEAAPPSEQAWIAMLENVTSEDLDGMVEWYATTLDA